METPNRRLDGLRGAFLALSLLMLGSSAFGATFITTPEEREEYPPLKRLQEEDQIQALIKGLPPGAEQLVIDDMVWDVSRLQKSGFIGGKWPSGVVYYRFADNINPTQQSQWLQAAKLWSRVANVSFVWRTTQANYVLVQSGSENSAQVGMQSGQQSMTIFNWNDVYIIAHEIGHTLGLVHEHQRSDRNTYVEYSPNCIRNRTEYEGNFDILQTNTESTPYDFDSLMHYAKDTFAWPDCNVLEPRRAEDAQWLDRMGQRDHLSEQDKVGMSRRYGRPLVPELEWLDFSIDDDNQGDSSGDGDGIPEPGEKIELNITLRNTGLGDATNTQARLTTSEECVRITDTGIELDRFPGSSTLDSRNVGKDFDFELDCTCANKTVRFNVQVTSDQHDWSFSFDVLTGNALQPNLVIDEVRIWDDAVFGGSPSNLPGDGDGQVDPGEVFAVQIRLRNVSGCDITSARGKLFSREPNFLDRCIRLRYLSFRPVFGVEPPRPGFRPFELAWDEIAVGEAKYDRNALGTLIILYNGSFSASTDAHCLGRVPMRLELEVDGMNLVRDFDIPIGAPPNVRGQTEVAADVPKDIADNTTVRSTLVVPNAKAIESLSDVNVRLSITHSHCADLSASLRSPAGTTVRLFSRVGGGGDNFTATILDDEALQSIDGGVGATAPFTGTFRPMGRLSSFDGQSPAGTWELSVTDHAGGDTGTLDAWGLTFNSDERDSTGSLRVTINPPAVRDAGARWRVDGGAWQESGVTVSGLPEGNHTVTFKEVTDWTTPSAVSQTVVAGQTATLTRTYEEAGCDPPAAPIGVLASDGTHPDRVRVTWQAVAGAGVEYRVYRQGQAVSNWQTARTYDDFGARAPSTTTTGSGCNSQTTTTYYRYTYTVRARTNCGQGTLSSGNEGYRGASKTIYETALPATKAAPHSELAVRVRSNAPIDPDSVWSVAEGSGWAEEGGVWRGTDPDGTLDGWIVRVPGRALIEGEVVHVTVGAQTLEGTPIGPITRPFTVGSAAPDKSTPAGELELMPVEPDSIPILDSATTVSAAYRLGPAGVFDEPVAMWIPLHENANPDLIDVYYYSESEEHLGWYRGEDVEGWLTDQNHHVVEEDGQVYIEILVNHSCVVQLGRHEPTGTAASTGALPVVLALLLARVFRKTRASRA